MKYLKKYIFAIGVFVLFDQVAKIIVYHCYFHNDMEVISDIIRFRPVINKNLSWGGNYAALFRSFNFVVIINIIIIFFIISSYSFYRRKRHTPAKIVNVIYIMGMAGAFSSLIDKVIWKGSLDYIQIPQLFTFDIKDIYISIAQCVFVFLGIKYSKEISAIEYITWCLKNK